MNIGAILQRKGTSVFTVAPDVPVRDVVRELADKGVGALVVTGEGHRVEGIVSERDVVARLASDGPGILDQPVRSVMTVDVTTCRRDDTVDDLMGRMTEMRIRHLPVCENDALVGIVSIGDVVKSRVDQLELETEQLQDYVSGNSY